MDSTRVRTNTESLDPADWEVMRELGHRMVDDMLAYLQTVRERPIWQPMPDEVKDHLDAPLPTAGQGAEAAYEDFKRDVLPYPMGNIHPRFWGWVMGNGSPLDMLSEMLAAGINSNLGGGEHAPSRVEAQVIDWCKEMLGFPHDASGLLVSGGSMANLIGLTVARNIRAGFDVRGAGLQSADANLTAYCSTETHSSVQRAFELLGLGSEWLRKIPVNNRFEIDTTVLEAAIAADRASGHRPFCVIGNAATTNTASFDDLEALADICAREELWFHVDGAFGALAALSPALRSRIRGMERADSLAFDLHKWFYAPFEVGAVLVRTAQDHYRSFTLTPDYLKHSERGLAGGTAWFSDYGIQLSRGFRALKVWMAIKAHGIDKYARLVEQNVEQAQYLGALVDAAPSLERLAPVFNTVCFRYVAEGMAPDALNALNEEILTQMQEQGVVMPSGTTLNGNYAIRVCITNHRTRFEDLDLMVAEAVRLGDDYLARLA